MGHRFGQLQAYHALNDINFVSNSRRCTDLQRLPNSISSFSKTHPPLPMQFREEPFSRCPRVHLPRRVAFEVDSVEPAPLHRSDQRFIDRTQSYTLRDPVRLDVGSCREHKLVQRNLEREVRQAGVLLRGEVRDRENGVELFERAVRLRDCEYRQRETDRKLLDISTGFDVYALYATCLNIQLERGGYPGSALTSSIVMLKIHSKLFQVRCNNF